MSLPAVAEPAVRAPAPVNSVTSHSAELGAKELKYILSGIDLKEFMSTNWERNPLHIQRKNASHYDRLNVSREQIDAMLRNNSIEFTKNLDVTIYEDGERKTFNPGKSDKEREKIYY